MKKEKQKPISRKEEKTDLDTETVKSNLVDSRDIEMKNREGKRMQASNNFQDLFRPSL